MPTHGYVSDRLPPTWFDHLDLDCTDVVGAARADAHPSSPTARVGVWQESHPESPT